MLLGARAFFPFKNGCSPLNYSGNSGVNVGSYWETPGLGHPVLEALSVVRTKVDAEVARDIAVTLFQIGLVTAEREVNNQHPTLTLHVLCMFCV
jgi:hypothetical protein